MKKIIIIGLVSVIVMAITLTNLKTDTANTTVREQQLASKSTKQVSKSPIIKSQANLNKTEIPHNSVSVLARPNQRQRVEVKVAARENNKELEKKIIAAGGNPDQLIKPRSSKELAL